MVVHRPAPAVTHTSQKGGIMNCMPEDSPAVRTPEQLEEEQFDVPTEFDDTYGKQINALPRPTRIIMEKIAYKIKNDGLSIDEACLLCNVDPDWLLRAIDAYPVIARAFEKKELEYRVNLMKPINKKARTDEKMAQYLLELRQPRARRNARAGEHDNSNDMLAMAISHIQEHGDSSPLVKKSSGAAVLMAKGASASKLIDRIKNIIPKSALK